MMTIFVKFHLKYQRELMTSNIMTYVMSKRYYMLAKFLWLHLILGLRLYASTSSGSGGMVSNALDMNQWMVAQLNEGQATDGTQVIPEEVLQVMTIYGNPIINF